MAARIVPAEEIRLDDILIMESFVDRFPDLCASVEKMRWLLFTRKTNGLEASGAIIKRAGRWYVCLPRYRDWMLHGAPEQLAGSLPPPPMRHPRAHAPPDPVVRRKPGRPRKHAAPDAR